MQVASYTRLSINLTDGASVELSSFNWSQIVKRANITNKSTEQTDELAFILPIEHLVKLKHETRMSYFGVMVKVARSEICSDVDFTSDFTRSFTHPSCCSALISIALP